MKREALFALLGGFLGGFLYQSCTPNVQAYGYGMGESAYRMAGALERIADKIERDEKKK